MPGAFDYLKWRGDITFRQVPLNEIDAMLFGMISYNYFEQTFTPENKNLSMTFEQFGQIYFENRKKNTNLGAIIPMTSMKALREMCKLTRYKDVVIEYFEYDMDYASSKQFCAVTFDMGNGASAVVYRGTDDTLIGWKENLYMPTVTATASELAALDYLTDISKKTSNRLTLIGHSKGGIMSIYAAASASPEIQERIDTIYSFDGPGTNSGLFDSDGYKNVREKYVHFIPQNSFVGLLMDNDGNHTVVKSFKLGGAFQHDCFSWELMGNKFTRVPLPRQTVLNAEITNQKISAMSKEETEEVITTLSSIIESTGAITLSDLTEKAILNIITMIKKLNNTDKVLKDNMYSVIGQLIKFKSISGRVQ